MRRSKLSTLGVVAGVAMAATQAQAAYEQVNLAATDAKYSAAIVDPSLTDAWGIAIRPAGFGGHFWVTANGSGQSVEYVGDVNGKPLFQDELKEVSIPGTGGNADTPAGVVFNASGNFSITQAFPTGAITNSARFLFASTDGTISGWTERKLPSGSFDRPGTTVTVIDNALAGSQFFGLGISQKQDRLYAADFGTAPGVRTYRRSPSHRAGRSCFTDSR
jgi:uncharacterized protein (TIGR03118 family)